MGCDHKANLVQFCITVEELRQRKVPYMYGVKRTKE